MLNASQAKNLIKSVNKLRKGFSVKAFYTVLDVYKKNISYEKTPGIHSVIYPVFAGEKHAYYMKSPFKIKIEAYIDKNTVNYVHFNYVSLWMDNGNGCILNQANTDLAKTTFLYVEQLHHNQRH